MNRFVNVKSLAGELKRSEVRRGVGYRLTTKELVLLREDQSFHIYLDDILGVFSQDEEDVTTHTEKVGDTKVSAHFGRSTYKIVTHKMSIYNRSGMHEKGSSTLYTSLSDGFSRQLLSLLKAQ
ncbi:MAG TPA: hypothetical protein VFV52_16280 [Bacilli bacterium]|nr:hypothetical protein [Bacilli bacterium]